MSQPQSSRAPMQRVTKFLYYCSKGHYRLDCRTFLLNQNGSLGVLHQHLDVLARQGDTNWLAIIVLRGWCRAHGVACAGIQQSSATLDLRNLVHNPFHHVLMRLLALVFIDLH